MNWNHIGDWLEDLGNHLWEFKWPYIVILCGLSIIGYLVKCNVNERIVSHEYTVLCGNGFYYQGIPDDETVLASSLTALNCPERKRARRIESDARGSMQTGYSFWNDEKPVFKSFSRNSVYLVKENLLIVNWQLTDDELLFTAQMYRENL